MGQRKVWTRVALGVLSVVVIAGVAGWYLGYFGATPANLSVTPTYQDVAYTPTAGTQKLNLYLPTGDGPFPVVVNIHGGGFKFGDRSMVGAVVGQALLDGGYAIASVDYRLSGEATFPAAVQDVKAAVRFLRANAAQYKLNPDQIVAFGFSAGGNLASMVGTTGDVAEFDDPALGNEGVSSRVQAVIDWFGPTDFGQMDEQAKAQGCGTSDQTHSTASSFESLYLGATVAESPELVQKANPISYITPDDPPFLLQKGDQDCTVPVGQSQLLADALKAAGADVRFDLLNGVGHGDSGSTLVFESAENVQVVLAFLDAKVK
ncbi:MAG: alpha/beta hydrolase fold domain-containing protein [Caldilineaceae bacterium]